MTHLSSFRYGPSVLGRPGEARPSSEVRVRYFDPRTGEPRGEKPEPLARRAEEKQSSYERCERRRAAEAEAAEIVEAMKRRRRAAGGDGSRTGGANGGRKRPGPGRRRLFRERDRGCGRGRHVAAAPRPDAARREGLRQGQGRALRGGGRMKTCGECGFYASLARSDGKGTCMALMTAAGGGRWAHPARERDQAACGFWTEERKRGRAR